jgi:ankyrin repeat protein
MVEEKPETRRPKSAIPWKSTLAILLFFGVVIAGCILLTPIRIQWHIHRFRSGDAGARAVAIKSLLEIGEEGRCALAKAYLRELNEPEIAKKLAGVDGLIALGEPGRKALIENFPEGGKAAGIVIGNWIEEGRKYNSEDDDDNWLDDDFYGKFGKSSRPLCLAAENGYTTTAELLIARRIYDDSIEFPLCKPVELAVAHGHLRMIKLLVAKGGRLFRPLLEIAAERGRMDVMTYLVESGLDPNGKWQMDWTPLHIATASGHHKIVEYLIELGGDINSKVFAGSSLLHIAAEEGHVEVVRFLIEKGLDVNYESTQGWSPLLLAEHFGYKDVAALLRKHGAKY